MGVVPGHAVEANRHVVGKDAIGRDQHGVRAHEDCAADVGADAVEELQISHLEHHRRDVGRIRVLVHLGNHVEEPHAVGAPGAGDGDVMAGRIEHEADPDVEGVGEQDDSVAIEGVAPSVAHGLHQ